MILSVLISLYPVGTRLLRLALLGCLAGVWASVLVLLWPRRHSRLGFLLLTGAAGIFLSLPGPAVDSDLFTHEYVRFLRSFEGTPYVWGGENGLGVDCSGLVRIGLARACGRLGFSSFNPRLLRAAFQLWWDDCTARELGTGAGGRTVPLYMAPSLNALTLGDLRPGDLAVTTDGIHVLAYLGNRRWIAADPDRGEVVVESIPSKNSWFSRPVRVVRWRLLAAL
ncbi:MAG: C40 family peptidase [Acidobacteria bacterium]|nr:C40 family peptidase [Acidobacteriota bacterium]